MSSPDPYQLDPSKVEEPPTNLRGSLKHLGPGFVLSASIVGSGELVATTTLGAKAGFVALWVILVSCLVKVAVQVEFGKRAIISGETTFASFNLLPGPKFGKANWSIWTWLVLMALKFMQQGGILGLLAVLINLAVPGISITVGVWLIVVVIAVIVSQGYYRLIEGLSVVMIGLFTIFTLVSLIALQSGAQAIGMDDLIAGLSFELSEDKAILFAIIGAFGITGVGGDEMMAYNYWLIEKGYAAKSGPCDNSDEWAKRARGWIKVMVIDAVAAMLVYTVVTAAFYMLGAALLHGKGEVPGKGEDFLAHLATMYTTTLGDWALPLFYSGAFVVLFSTAFSALAAWTRLFSDAFGRVGLFDFGNRAQRNRCIFRLAWIIPVFWAASFFVMEDPVFMVIMGGFITSFILLLVLFATIFFKSRDHDERLSLGLGFSIWFWLSAAMILFVGVWSTAKHFIKTD